MWWWWEVGEGQLRERGGWGRVAGVLWGRQRWPPPACLSLWSLSTRNLRDREGVSYSRDPYSWRVGWGREGRGFGHSPRSLSGTAVHMDQL